MIEVRPFDGLGHFRNEWLDTHHHFSFDTYMDPRRMSWGPLRVWNDDLIAPGTGFGMHGHRDMEIITYVREGAISHRDSLGNEGRTVAGDVQVMSAGTGIMHAEFNQGAEPVLLFQIWILPNRQGLKPRWETRAFPRQARHGKLVALASGRPGDGDAIPIHQDAALLGASLAPGESVTYGLDEGRRAYVVPTVAGISINGVAVPPRAGAAIAGERMLNIQAEAPTELIVADLP
ncbi:MAG: pirin family protein [Alphaproteobacteria bacterium]|nr:pirin family protein [Alphaproteobacteria bacterium]